MTFDKTCCSLMIACLLGASQASAATVYFGEDLGLGEEIRLTSFPNSSAARANFAANLSEGVSTESFESFASGASAPLELSFTGTKAPIKATLGVGAGEIAEQASGTNGFGRYPTDGNKYLETSTSAFTVVFDRPVAAFGFDGIDVGDFAGQVTVTTAGGSTNTYTVGNTISGAGGSVLFWGLIDTRDLFTSISLGNTNSGVDAFGFDRMTVAEASQVPLPAGLPLILSGLAGIALLRRGARSAGPRAS